MELTFPESFPLMYQQKKAGHCSVYLLANIFRDKSLLPFIENPHFAGCDDKEMNVMLDEYGLNISTLMYINQSLPPIPKLTVYENIKYHNLGEAVDARQGSILASVYFMTVKLFEDIDMWHHVAIIKIRCNLYYIDPYNQSAFLVNRFCEFENRFHSCCQVQMPHIKNTNQFAYLFADQLGYTEFFK